MLLDIYSTFRAENVRASEESATRGVPVEPIEPSALAVEVAAESAHNVVPLKPEPAPAEGAQRPPARKRAAKKATKSGSTRRAE